MVLSNLNAASKGQEIISEEVVLHKGNVPQETN